VRQTWQVQTEGRYVITEATLAGKSPTVRMRQLGMELRRLRENAGKKLKEAALYVDLTESALSKMETGDRRVRVIYVRNLCQLYDVDAAHTEFLIRLSRESAERGWWADYGNTVPTWFVDYLGMETVAQEVWTYESELVPGLLQTHEYAEAVRVGIPPEDLERLRSLRAVRQQRLVDDKDPPLILRAILNEPVVCRPVGGPEVMHRQIRHIIDTASLPNATIQLLPLSVGWHPAMTGPFTALRFPETPMNTVYVEMQTAAVYMEKPSDIQHYTTGFERLSELALDKEGTISFLEQKLRGGAET
jgi:transcriptional regulator with XRE-family HTH domain